MPAVPLDAIEPLGMEEARRFLPRLLILAVSMSLRPFIFGVPLENMKETDFLTYLMWMDDRIGSKKTQKSWNLQPKPLRLYLVNFVLQFEIF